MLQKIKPLHDLGFANIWLKPKSKRPVETAWTTGPRHEWSTLELFYKKNSNVGVRVGEPSKLSDGTFLSVIDCDVKSEDPAHLREMEKALDQLQFDWTTAPIVVSGRGNGSKHIYIRTDEPLSPFRLARSHHMVKVSMPSVSNFSRREEEQLSVEEMAQGIHIRPAWEISAMGTGQQVVLPPSIHPDTGKAYLWETGEPTSVNDFPLANIVKPENAGPLGPLKVIKNAPEFEHVIVDLVSAKIPDWVFDMIVKGSGLEKYDNDRSAALYAVTLCLINADFSDLEIMSVLTDPSNELSWAAYEHTKSKDRKRAAAWIYKYTIQKARYSKSAEKAFSDEMEIEEKVLTEEEIALQEEELLGDWRERMDKNFQTGKPKPTIKNVILVLENYCEKAIFEFDSFYQAEQYASEPPWKDGPGIWTGKAISDSDIGRIKNWFGERFGFEPSDNTISGAVSVVARRNSRHPVQKYVKELVWDGKARLDTWLKKYMNAEGPDEYLAAVGRKLLCACVARVMNPGCKWDYVVIFEGKQGIGKSTACSILGGSWFTDTIGDITNKDAVEAMRGKWIIEIGELAVMRKYEVENLKHFITVRTDNVRKAYARKSEEYPRQCVFIGTTNRQDYLKDETGNRRFWPVKVHGVRFNELIRDRDQLWAEACEKWIEGEELYLSGDIEKMAKEIQASRMEHDEWESIIDEVLSEDDFLPENGFRLLDLWKRMSKLSDIDGMKFGNAQQHRLGRCLRIMGYEVRIKREKKSLERKWFRLNNAEAAPKVINSGTM